MRIDAVVGTLLCAASLTAMAAIATSDRAAGERAPASIGADPRDVAQLDSAAPSGTETRPEPTAVEPVRSSPVVPPAVRPPVPAASPPPAAATTPAASTPQPAVDPWIVESFDYESTEDLLAYPNPRWSGPKEDVRTDRIALDTDVPAGVEGKSMRYDQEDRSGDPRLCHDYTIGRNLRFPEQVPEVWVEMYVKFSAGFATVVPGGRCRGVSSAGYKFVFGRVPVGSRFHLIVGTNGRSNTFGYPGREQEWENGTPPSARDYFDGRWHQWRFHFKVGYFGEAAFAFDGRLAKAITRVPIARAGIYGLALGRNLNQGPVRPQSIWWAGIKVYRTDPGWGW